MIIIYLDVNTIAILSLPINYVKIEIMLTVINNFNYVKIIYLEVNTIAIIKQTFKVCLIKIEYI